MIIQRRGEDHYDWTLYRGRGPIAVEWYFRERTALPTSIMLYHLEPGAEEGLHLHRSGDETSCSPGDSEELYLVVSGEVVITIDGERAVLRPGDAAYAPAGSRHGVANESAEPAELVLAFGPPQPSTEG
ncbi:cupin domain-containing protein [Microlunatus sp. GCM10028923]|uniref:cupin domain-containing protein n=1 Tax=Microlunatus sp. GCM10028923 TaxID=3273400 RepID=UPI00360E7374